MTALRVTQVPHTPAQRAELRHTPQPRVRAQKCSLDARVGTLTPTVEKGDTGWKKTCGT